MKNLTILSAAAAFALAACGCSKEATEEAPVAQGVRVSFRGEYAPTDDTTLQTRVIVDPATGKTSWVAGDRCGVWVSANSDPNAPFENTEAAPDLFTGTLDAGLTSTEPVWAYYPYAAETTVDAGTVRSMEIVLPANQTQAGSRLGSGLILTAAGTLGQDADGNPRISAMQFIHQTAGLCFNVYGSLRAISTNPETLTGIAIESSTPMNGTLRITDPAVLSSDWTAGTAAPNSIELTVDSPTATIGYAKADGNKALVSVIPSTQSIDRIVITTDQAVYTKEFSTAKTLELQAGHIYPVNLDLNTFTVQKKYSLGVPGDHNGWSSDNGITGRTAGFYSGMVSFAGNYKYKKDETWYGHGGEPSTLYYILSTTGGNFNITGNYYVVANTHSSNASLIATVLLPGTWNSFSLTDAPAFTYDADRDLWILKGQAMTAGDEFKVVFNGTWVNNMNRSIPGGGTVSPDIPVHLEYEGSKNIAVGETGTYDVLFDLSTYGGTLVLKSAAAK